MKKLFTGLAAATSLATLQPAFALGLFDGEVGLEWWNTQFDIAQEDDSFDVGTYGIHAEGWWDQDFGLRAAWFDSDLETQELSNDRRFNLDFKRRIFSPTDNSYLAAGIGWQNLSLTSGDSSNGARLLFEGSAGLVGVVSLYGQATWLPWLNDADHFTDLSGSEWEIGLKVDPMPFLTFSGGYRRFRLDYTDEQINDEGSSTSDGVFLGLGIHW